MKGDIVMSKEKLDELIAATKLGELISKKDRYFTPDYLDDFDDEDFEDEDFDDDFEDEDIEK